MKLVKETITAAELKNKRKQYYILDVREPDEFAEGHIEGAVNIPLGKLIRDLNQGIIPKDKHIVVHCRSGGRGAIALETLKKKGFKNVQNLEGGFMAWSACA